MKIAINCAFFQPKGGGIKEYIQNLVENLSKLDYENEYILYVLSDNIEYAKNELKTNFRIKSIPYRGKSLWDIIKRSVFENLFWIKEEQLEKWDIFHSPFFHGPTLRNTKLILTVHDMRFFRYPKTYTFLRYQYLKRAVKSSINRADRIISISEFTKNEIQAAYGIDEDKITVIHEAINPEHFGKSKLSLEDNAYIKELKDVPYILSVGHLEPRKNYDRLIEAFKKIKSRLTSGTKLIIIGKKGHGYESTLRKIEEDNDVLYLNFVSQGLLNWLYKNSILFVFPSFYEGFGFPPLEAGIHGAVASVSNVSSMPEVCGDAVSYFNPLDIDEMAKVIFQTFNNECLRNRLKNNMQEQLLRFSWEKNAKETISLYNSIMLSK